MLCEANRRAIRSAAYAILLEGMEGQEPRSPGTLFDNACQTDTGLHFPGRALYDRIQHAWLELLFAISALQRQAEHMGKLVRGSRVLESTEYGVILEISFGDRHDYRHGNEMGQYIETQVREHRPAAILCNLLEYQYSSGNDVGSLVSMFSDAERKGIRPVCIVAKGNTCQSLHALFQMAKLTDTLKVDFVPSVESGLRRLRERLQEIPR